MKVKIICQTFNSRESAVNWMVNQYKNTPDEQIVTSNFAEDNTTVTGYFVVRTDVKKEEKPTNQITID